MARGTSSGSTGKKRTANLAKWRSTGGKGSNSTWAARAAASKAAGSAPTVPAGNF